MALDGKKMNEVGPVQSPISCHDANRTQTKQTTKTKNQLKTKAKAKQTKGK
jgi:hypothetical protein